MKNLALVLLVFSCTVSAADIDKETYIRKQVQLKIAIAQTEYCDNELNKLESANETPFMLNQKNPAETNKRFAQNKLSLEEEIGYKEFSNYCAVAFAQLKTLTKELQQK